MTPLSEPARVLVLSTLGAGSNEENRIGELLHGLPTELFPFDRARKMRMFWRLLKTIRRRKPAVTVMEGTGLAGGAALVLGRVLFGRKYVVSSGDAVGPWVGSRCRLLGPVFGLYERVLYRMASGFIGWTPYLVGRALTFGCPRGVTAAGWAPFTRTTDEQARDRSAMRAELGIPHANIVVGIAGSMVWTRRYGYSYGLELVEAAHRVRRPDVTFLLVGDGSGKAKLEARAAGLPPGRVVFVGRVPQAALPAYYAAMDIGSLPQSVDRVGAFRYTTKLSEYFAFRLPVITSQIPVAYDLDRGCVWRLPGDGPWESRYVISLATLLDELSADDLVAKKLSVQSTSPDFRRDLQVQRVTELILDLIGRPPTGTSVTANTSH